MVYNNQYKIDEFQLCRDVVYAEAHSPRDSPVCVDSLVATAPRVASACLSVLCAQYEIMHMLILEELAKQLPAGISAQLITA
jgi:hypothetical protein